MDLKLMEYSTPAGNVITWVRKSFSISESKLASTEFRVMDILRGKVRVIQCVEGSLHEFTESAKKIGFLMEFATCGDLVEHFKMLKKNIGLVKTFTRSILTGLASIHEAGIIHGDLQPENVLVFEGGVLKIAVFGVSKHIEDSSGWWTEETCFLGALQYMSPEYVMEGKLVPAHDIWALGCTVLEMLTDKPLWGKRLLSSEQIHSNLVANTKPPHYSSIKSKAAESFLTSECVFY